MSNVPNKYYFLKRKKKKTGKTIFLIKENELI